MRIAYIINQYPKVSHSFIRREIQALERRGLTIFRIALRGWQADLVDEEDKSERDKTRYVLRDGALPLLAAFFQMLVSQPRGMLKGFGLAWTMGRHAERPLAVHLVYLAEACRIRVWLMATRVDHLHAHFGTNSAEIAMLVHALGGPDWSFTVHGPEEFDKPYFIGLAEKIRWSAFVVAISSFGRSQLYRLVASEYWPKIHVVRCGIDQAFHSGSPTKAPTLPRFVCVGRLCEQKGQMLLLQATTILAARGIGFEVVLAGDGEMREEIEVFICRHKLRPIVRITGWISSDQVRNELLAGRALTLPSFAEGLPVVIMEAMALRRPIITTYVAGIPELVEPHKHGWLVPAGDVNALVDAMQACIEAHDDTLIAMGDAARERVLGLHDVDEEAAKLARLFQMAANGDRFRVD